VLRSSGSVGLLRPRTFDGRCLRQPGNDGRRTDVIDSYRDLLSRVMETPVSTVSNRLNVVMKQLTIVATIFLPLSSHRVLRPELLLLDRAHRRAVSLHCVRTGFESGRRPDPTLLLPQTRLARRSQVLEPGARAGYGRLVGILGYGCHARLSPSQDDPAVEHRVSRSLPPSAL
jgi:hypothetical protein